MSVDTSANDGARVTDEATRLRAGIKAEVTRLRQQRRELLDRQQRPKITKGALPLLSVQIDVVEEVIESLTALVSDQPSPEEQER